MDKTQIIDTAYNYLHNTLGISECTHLGIAANIDEWVLKKKPLIDTLRKHPDWSENDLAIVTEIEEKQGINKDYFGLCYSLYNAASNANGCMDWNVYCEIISSCFCNKISCAEAELINTVCPELKIYPNTKSSRVLHKFFQHIGFDKLSEFEKIFAQISDCLSTKVVIRKAVLSVNPLDFLTMSNGNSWSNCLTLTPATNYDGFRYKGKHKAGTLSYMTDEVSCLFYTLDKNSTGPLWSIPKITRQVIFYRLPLIVHERIYPKSVEYIDEPTNLYVIYKNAVQKLLSECEGIENQWEYNDTYIKRSSNCFVYPDWKYYTSIRCVNLSVPRSFNSITVGGKSYCIHCGNAKYKDDDDSCATLLCEDCEEENDE